MDLDLDLDRSLGGRCLAVEAAGDRSLLAPIAVTKQGQPNQFAANGYGPNALHTTDRCDSAPSNPTGEASIHRRAASQAAAAQKYHRPPSDINMMAPAAPARAARARTPAAGPPQRRPQPRRQPEWLPIRCCLLLLSLLALLPRRAVARLQPEQQPHQGSSSTCNSKLPPPPHRVTIVGSGNFGSAVARLLGRNVLGLPRLFAPDIRMWVFEEEVSFNIK